MSTHARGTFEVKGWDEKPYEEIADEAKRAVVAECEMVNPIDESCASVIAKFMAQFFDGWISRGE